MYTASSKPKVGGVSVYVCFENNDTEFSASDGILKYLVLIFISEGSARSSRDSFINPDNPTINFTIV